MQATKMDFRQIHDVVNNPTDGIEEKKETLISNLSDDPKTKSPIDSGTALQMFFDHIPVSSIPGIKNPPVLELKTGDSVKDAIRLLYEKNVFGAPITDMRDTDTPTQAFSDRYIGFIDFACMVLWCLEELEKTNVGIKGVGDDTRNSAFFSMLEQNPHIGETKVGELAKAFLWNPFFPVNLDDTLFHVLLLLSKHRLQVVPVVDKSSSQVIGFVTQSAVIQLLLHSSGLEWFDNIADKVLSEFRFENEENAAYVYGDQSLAEALHVLWINRIGTIAVVNRETKKLIGSMKSNDVYFLLTNDNLVNRKSLTIEEFIHMETEKIDSDPDIQRDIGALISAGTLRLRNSFLPRMDSPVTNKRNHTLKQAMKNLAETKGNFSILINDSHQPTGVLTLRDIIIQFAPPDIDSSFHGGTFFESAIEQTGCHVKNGIMISDH